jgi:hypothetical protein
MCVRVKLIPNFTGVNERPRFMMPDAALKAETSRRRER